MLRLEYAIVSLVRSCACDTTGMPKCGNNSSTKACSLLAVGDLKNRIVYLRDLQRETNAVKNFLATEFSRYGKTKHTSYAQVAQRTNRNINS
jgi:hypothetical protein